MSRERMALLGAAGLVLVFVLASVFYQSEQAAKTQAAARAADSPLERKHSHTSGPDDARVTLVEFFDPACETCRVFSQHVKTLLAAHPDKLRLVLRYAPLHPGSDTMVKILEAAHMQGKFWETLEVMYKTQPMWASHHHPQPEKIWQFLPHAGVDVERIRKDISDPRLDQILAQDIADGHALNVRKTPQFFVNGKPLAQFGVAPLKALVDAEIAAQY